MDQMQNIQAIAYSEKNYLEISGKWKNGVHFLDGYLVETPTIENRHPTLLHFRLNHLREIFDSKSFFWKCAITSIFWVWSTFCDKMSLIQFPFLSVWKYLCYLTQFDKSGILNGFKADQFTIKWIFRTFEKVMSVKITKISARTCRQMEQ